MFLYQNIFYLVRGNTQAIWLLKGVEGRLGKKNRMIMLSVHGMQLDELKEWMSLQGHKPFHAQQLIEWIYAKGILDPALMTTFSLKLRELIAKELSLQTIRCVKTCLSDDGETEKFLWELADGLHVESVLISSDTRRTVCVSSQVGCPARCSFCASGKQGLLRQLSTGEIIEQVYHIDRVLKEKGERVCHVVFMGMGEPLENYEAVVKALRLLSDADRLCIGQRRITVSTVGVVPGIERFAEEGLQVNLALSLHAPSQHLRKKIIPYARKYSLEEVLKAVDLFAKKTKRDITYEYTMLAGINDSPSHAEELAELLRGQKCTVNLIPYNPIDGVRFGRPEGGDIEAFRDILSDLGVRTTWRYTKGKDIAAACGQLALVGGRG